MQVWIQAWAQHGEAVRPCAQRSGSWQRSSEEMTRIEASPSAVDQEWAGRARSQEAAQRV